jgi:hypothetical protein
MAVLRSSELRDALRAFTPFAVERDGEMTGYLTAPTFWLTNHGVSETEADKGAYRGGGSRQRRAGLLPAPAAAGQPVPLVP